MLIVGMALIANEHNIGNTYFTLFALAFGVPFCLLYAMREQHRQEKLRGRSQVMESLTRMAGGIGHDFSNLLTGIQGNAELAEQKLDRNHVALPYLQAMLRESQKAQLFSAQLLAFSGGVVTGRERLDLRAELLGIASLLESAMPRGVRVRLEAEQSLPLVGGNRAQLQELIVASILHVADSLPEGATEVRVTLRNVVRRHGQELVLQARHSKVSEHLADFAGTASGRTNSVRFDLASAQLTMRDHDGRIEVHGDWRSGVAISLRFPGLPATQARPVKPVAPAPLVARHVLLLVAARRVRAVAEDLLRELGHRVTCALTEQDAAARIAGDSSIDVVLIDARVAESQSLLEQIEAVRPNLPVLLAERPDGNAKPPPAPANSGVVAKPYSMAGLNSALSELFSKQSS